MPHRSPHRLSDSAGVDSSFSHKLPRIQHLGQALESGREARARAQRQAEVAAARAAERQQAPPPAPKLEEFIRLTQLLRCLQRRFAVAFKAAFVFESAHTGSGVHNATRHSLIVATTTVHAGAIWL
jgi:hypothetical protein